VRPVAPNQPIPMTTVYSNGGQLLGCRCSVARMFPARG
jgi:hypothetical protein